MLDTAIILTHQFNYNGHITKYVANTYGSTPYGDYLRMKDDLEKLELDQSKFTHTPPLSKKDRNNKKKLESMRQLQFNTEYVIAEKERCGSLTCVFCGQPNLVIYNWADKNKKLYNMATVDHFNPKSNGGKPYDKDNLVVACHRCNRNKGSNVWSIRKLRYLNHYGNFKEIVRKLVY